MVEQMQKGYTITTPTGIEVPVTYMSKEDIEREMAEFEAKYGMSSAEFASKWSTGELYCAQDFFDWAADCEYMFVRHGLKELEIVRRGAGE